MEQPSDTYFTSVGHHATYKLVRAADAASVHNAAAFWSDAHGAAGSIASHLRTALQTLIDPAHGGWSGAASTVFQQKINMIIAYADDLAQSSKNTQGVRQFWDTMNKLADAITTAQLPDNLPAPDDSGWAGLEKFGGSLLSSDPGYSSGVPVISGLNLYRDHVDSDKEQCIATGNSLSETYRKAANVLPDQPAMPPLSAVGSPDAGAAPGVSGSAHGIGAGGFNGLGDGPGDVPGGRTAGVAFSGIRPPGGPAFPDGHVGPGFPAGPDGPGSPVAPPGSTWPGTPDGSGVTGLPGTGHAPIPLHGGTTFAGLGPPTVGAGHHGGLADLDGSSFPGVLPHGGGAPSDGAFLDGPVYSGGAGAPGTGRSLGGELAGLHLPGSGGADFGNGAGRIGTLPGALADGGGTGALPDLSLGTGSGGVPGTVGAAAGGPAGGSASAGGRAGAPGFGAMPLAAGGRAGAQGEQEQSRSTWLTEDEDVWGADTDGLPIVIDGHAWS